jgi:cytochrome c
MAVAGGLAGGTSALAAQDELDMGQRVYEQCWACHGLKPGEHRVGPSLHGVFGREAGSVESFNRYSEAMKDSDVVWSAETLDAYITHPQSFMPGTRMTYPGLQDREMREALIAYLKHATR